MDELAVWFGSLKLDGEKVDVIPLKRDLDVLTEHALGIENTPRLEASMSELALSSSSFTRDEYYSMLKQVASRVALHRLKESIPQDWEAIRAVDSLDELTRCANLLGEKLKEGEEMALLAGQELSWNRSLERAVGALVAEREQLVGDVERAVLRCAPNTAQVATPLVAARLMAEAGSLRRLATLPASSIQVLGARAALFRHLKGRAPSPKHGVIYNHPALAKSPREKRGRCARVLAAHIAIAARLDYFRGTLDEEFVGKFGEWLGKVLGV
ncbi:MAG: NOP5/NOP56 family protein [Methermicoccaceae archaeon]